MPKFQSFLSGTLYEIIAYFGSGCVFIVLGSLGFADTQILEAFLNKLVSLQLHDQVAFFVVLSIITYAYGQLASTLSAPFVATPLGKVIKHIRKNARIENKVGGRVYKFLNRKISKDFSTNFRTTLEAYELDAKLPEDKKNNKWTLMFYLQLRVPSIGNDILKRYAREKLARINAFNLLTLSVLGTISFCSTKIVCFKSVIDWSKFSEISKIPEPWIFGLYLLLGATYTYEYYKRKCWNNDLLIKVLPLIDKVDTSEVAPALPTDPT